MESLIIIYTNNEGYLEFRRVPKNLPPNKYEQGIFCGPPDISGIDLSEDEKRMLNNALVNAGYKDFPALAGQRANLLRLIISTLGVSEEKARSIRHQLLYLYTRDYYPEKYDED